MVVAANSRPGLGLTSSWESCGARLPNKRKVFIPIYPNGLPNVPKPSRASRTTSLVFIDLPASQGAITRLLNRFGGLKISDEGSNPSLSVSHQVRAFLPHALSEDRLPKLPSQARTSPRLPHSRPFVHSPSIHRAAESSAPVLRPARGVVPRSRRRRDTPPLRENSACARSAALTWRACLGAHFPTAAASPSVRARY